MGRIVIWRNATKKSVSADEQGRPNPSLGTNKEAYKASRQIQRGLRHFYFERILSIVANLTAIAEKYPVYSVKSFYIFILSTR